MDTYKIGSVVKQTPDYAAIVAIKTEESITIVEIALTGAITINLDAASKPVIGDRVIFIFSSDATPRDATFGTNFTGPVLAGVASKTNVQEFVYDGGDFVAVSSPIQIN